MAEASASDGGENTASLPFPTEAGHGRDGRRAGQGGSRCGNLGVGRGGRVFYPGHRNKEYVRAVKLYIVHRYTGTVKVG